MQVMQVMQVMEVVLVMQIMQVRLAHLWVNFRVISQQHLSHHLVDCPTQLRGAVKKLCFRNSS